jgi:M6 family metalloprotease-like protein
MIMKKIITSSYHQIISSLLLLFLAIANINAAPLKNIPVTVVQQTGDVLHIFASGDEFFNYLHDADGFTIIQNAEGNYMYAIYEGDKIVPSQFMVGAVNPAEVGLSPFVLLSNEQYQEKRAQWFKFEDISRAKTPGRNQGTLNNLVVFIRFSDEANITTPFSSINNIFNNQTPGYNSMVNYFNTTSYGKLHLPSSFYPAPDENLILSYRDIYPRSYFQPYHPVNNPNGYDEDDWWERAEREHDLLRRAVEYIADMVPADLNIDYDDDGDVDNVCFVVSGNVGAWNTLLWPHKWSLFSQHVTIRGKRVYEYNFMLIGAPSYFNTAVLSHEMQHTLGFPDLYHYATEYRDLRPVGNWDIMESNPNPPQQSGAYMKWKYGNWLNQPTVIQPGRYTLNSVGSGTGIVSYKIPSSVYNQFFVLEFRNPADPFENFNYGNLPGLLIYRINTTWDGNAAYNGNDVFDEVYIFRPNGSTTEAGIINQANFGVNGRVNFNPTTNPKPFLTDGTFVSDLFISDITIDGNQVSFTYSKDSIPPVYYRINATAVTNDGPGTIEPSGEIEVLENTNQTFIIQAEEGGKCVYEIQFIIVDGVVYEPQNDEERRRMEYTFVKVTEDHTIEAVFGGVGINENKKSKILFTIQPNPAKDNFEITFQEPVYTQIPVQIFDIQGLLLKTIYVNNEKTAIDISNFAKGFYIVMVGNEAKKLIKR